jgi:glycosyltransferase involved in cell wall biosynthesis
VTETFIHVPPPGIDPNSTVITVIDDLIREAVRHQDTARVVGETWRLGRIDPQFQLPITPRHLLGTGMELKVKIALDHAAALTTSRRPFVERMYSASLSHLEASSRGHLFLHDASFAYGGVRPARKTFRDNPLYFYSHIPLSRSVSRRELRKLLSTVDSMICVSESLADDIAARAANGARLEIVHNGVDTETFHPRASGLASEPRVLFAGLFNERKGVDLLLDAYARIPARDGYCLELVGANWYGSTFGTAPFDRALAQKAQAAANRVEFSGFIDHAEMPNRLRAARVFCFPSMWPEPFGIALLEAMASGLPCIASERGGIREFAGDAVVYADPTDTNALAEAIDWLLSSEGDAAELGDRARARALEFSVSRQFGNLRRIAVRAG